MNYSTTQVLIAGALLLVCCGYALAQMPPPVPEMRISVVLPKGTGAANFQVLDNGVPRSAAPATTTPLGDACKAPTPLPAVGGGTYTNCVAAPAAPGGSLVVIVLDWTGMQPSHFRRVRAGVLRMLAGLRPADRAGLYSLSASGLRVLHDCVLDSAALIDRATKASAVPTEEGLQAFERALADSRLSSLAALSGAEHIDAIRAFAFIADHLSQFRVRKNVIWISGDFPLAVALGQIVKDPKYSVAGGMIDLGMRRLMRALGDGEPAVYSIDAWGVDLRGGSDVFAFRRPGARLGSNETRVANTTIRMSKAAADHPSAENIERMKVLADFTGARAYHNTEDFPRVLRDVLEDAERSISVAYARQAGAADGTLHKLRVRANQSESGLRFPKGYLDLPPHPREQASRDAELTESFNNPLDTSEIILHAQLQPHPKAAGASQVRLYVEKPHGSSDPRMDVMVVEKLSGGRTEICAQVTVPAAQPSQTGEAAGNNNGVWLNQGFRCSVGTRWARVVVQDMESGALGSVTIPLTASKR